LLPVFDKPNDLLPFVDADARWHPRNLDHLNARKRHKIKRRLGEL
jgi:hypothetical protein